MLAENDAALGLFQRMGDVRRTGMEDGVVELVMDLPDDGIPEPLQQTVRAAARGDVRHHARHVTPG